MALKKQCCIKLCLKLKTGEEEKESEGAGEKREGRENQMHT